jgi:hypothetical protein
MTRTHTCLAVDLMCLREAGKVGHKEQVKEQLDVRRLFKVLKLRVIE